MKTTVITIVSAVLGALGTAAAAKWALPPEAVSAFVEALVGVVGAAFGIYSALHTPGEKPAAK